MSKNQGGEAMKNATLVLVATLLTACASQDETEQPSTPDMMQAVRDFIEVRDLQEVNRLSTSANDNWDALNNQFVLYEGRRETHLIEFNRRCWELDDNTRIVADKRSDLSYIRARFDTLRGCRIHRIYALRDGEAAELESIGEAVGSRN